jgi:hypothetical protein
MLLINYLVCFQLNFPLIKLNNTILVLDVESKEGDGAFFFF